MPIFYYVSFLRCRLLAVLYLMVSIWRVAINKTADLLGDDLAANLDLLPQSWIDCSTEEVSQ